MPQNPAEACAASLASMLCSYCAWSVALAAASSRMVSCVPARSAAEPLSSLEAASACIDDVSQVVNHAHPQRGAPRERVTKWHCGQWAQYLMQPSTVETCSLSIDIAPRVPELQSPYGLNKLLAAAAHEPRSAPHLRACSLCATCFSCLARIKAASSEIAIAYHEALLPAALSLASSGADGRAPDCGAGADCDIAPCATCA
eukprot:7189275-Prymnesium_polylepis.1